MATMTIRIGNRRTNFKQDTSTGGIEMKKKMIAVAISLTMAVTCAPSFASATGAPQDTQLNETAASAQIETIDSEVESEQSAPDEAVADIPEPEAQAEEQRDNDQISGESSLAESPEKNTGSSKSLMAAKATNTTYKKATPITIKKGTKISGSTNSSQKRWYKFSLAKTTKVKIKFESSEGYSYLYICSQDDPYNEAHFMSTDNISTEYLQKGNYYFDVYSYGNAKFSIEIVDSKPVTDIAEPNDSMDAAKKFKPNKRYNAVIATYGSDLKDDTDHVYINTSKAGTYKLTLNAKSMISNKGSSEIQVWASDEYGNDADVFMDSYSAHSYASVKNGTKEMFTLALPKGKTIFEFYGGYSSNSRGEYSFELVRVPSKATGVKVSKRGKSALTITCRNLKYKDGYQVKYKANNGKWTSGKKYKTNTFKLAKLKKNTKYSVKVRVYKVVNGKTYYGPWSKVVSTKTRK